MAVDRTAQRAAVTPSGDPQPLPPFIVERGG